VSLSLPVVVLNVTGDNIDVFGTGFSFLFLAGSHRVPLGCRLGPVGQEIYSGTRAVWAWVRHAGCWSSKRILVFGLLSLCSRSV